MKRRGMVRIFLKLGASQKKAGKSLKKVSSN
jgi:hypothetical protein